MNNIKTTNDNINDKNDLEAIKRDINHLTQNLSELKQDSFEGLVNQITNLSKVMERFKDTGVDLGKEKLEDIYSSTREHPLRNLIYAFGAGMLAAILLKK